MEVIFVRKVLKDTVIYDALTNDGVSVGYIVDSHRVIDGRWETHGRFTPVINRRRFNRGFGSLKEAKKFFLKADLRERSNFMSFEKIDRIVKHFEDRIPGDRVDLMLDIGCVHKTHNLDLDSMLEDLDSPSVAHDVAGIYNYLDRKTKQLTRGWTPRFSRDWEEIQDAQDWEHDKSLIVDDNGKVIGKRRGLHR